MDGSIDAYYSEEQTMDYMYPSMFGYPEPEDYTGVFRLCYDFQYLYLIAIITDDISENYHWEYDDSWMFDNIEWFVQLDTQTVTTEYDDGTRQFRICRGLDSVLAHIHNSIIVYVPEQEFGYSMGESTATGWVTEVAMPWEAAYTGGVLPQDIHSYMEDAMGFDFSGADADNTDGDPTIGNRDYQAAWDLDGQDGTEDLAWYNVRSFGYITFGMVNSVENNDTQDFLCFPNPASERLFIQSAEKVLRIEILDLSGILRLTSELSADNSIDLSGLQTGQYFIKIFAGDKRFVTKSFTIVKT